MLGIQELLAQLVDVLPIVARAVFASHIRFEEMVKSRFDSAFTAFSVAFALVSFPAFGLYESWRGRSRVWLVGLSSLAWITVRAGCLVLTFSLHRTDVISRLWFADWTAMTGGAADRG